MKKLVLGLLVLVAARAHAAGGHRVGFDVGGGFPYVSQVNLDYVHSSGMFSIGAGMNQLSLSVTDVSVALTKPELMLRYHPFEGSFYLGLGLGQETLTAKSSETVQGVTAEVKVEVTATTLTPTIGWLWGIGDGGFFGGFDLGMQNPSGATATASTNTTDSNVLNDPDYQKALADTEDAAKKFGETSLPVFAFRIGYLF